MSNKSEQAETRLPTAAEIAVMIKLWREMRHWSQEQLAEIAGLNVRTVQRVEQGLAASFDTRRALSRAFEFDDIDLLNKPVSIPTPEAMRAEIERFEREYVTLSATPVTNGKELARLVESCTMDMSEPAFEMSRDADRAFAALIDYFRDYRDCADLYAETQKFEVYDDLQSQIDELRELGVSLCHATRKIQVRFGSRSDGEPMPATVLYVVAFPLGKEPAEFATPKSAGIRL